MNGTLESDPLERQALLRRMWRSKGFEQTLAQVI